MMNRKKTIVLRARLAFMGVVLFAAAIFARAAWIQFGEGKKWQAEMAKHAIKRRVIHPTRGNIFSDNGSLMATSLPFYRVAFDPTLATKDIWYSGIDSLALMLSRQFKDHPAAEYKRRLSDARKTRREFMYLHRGVVNYQIKKQMMRWPIFREGKNKGGVIFEKNEFRYMPFRSLATRAIGYSLNDTGRAGVEFSYNHVLAGVNGEAIFRKMAGGYWRPIYEITKPVRGLDIQTTIDVNVQDVAQASLYNALVQHNANFGCVVVMKVETGEIKAMANLGRNSKGEYVEKYNYAVAARTDPGSTLKLASYMAMLEEGFIKPEQKIETGNGVWEVADSKMTDSKPGGYGTITVQEAFEKSSNVATSKLTQACFGRRPSKYLEYLTRFGLDKNLDFQLKGEAQPYIKKLGDPTWSGTTLPWMSVGYELLLTPLQVLTFYNGVANGGTVVQPILVREVRDGDQVIEKFKAKVLAEDIASEPTLETVKQMLIGVVEHGTASNIRNTEYQIAGKTGTAQKIINGKYSQRYYTSFCGFFPAEKPKYSCIVVIDEPKGYQQYGADVAAPVFKEVSEKVNSLEIDMHKELPRPESPSAQDFPMVASGNFADLNFLCNKLGVSNYGKGAVQEWVRAKPVNNAVQWQPLIDHQGRLHDVRGMTLKDALYLLENQGYSVSHIGHGRVKQQYPAPGTALYKGTHISILLK